MRTPIRIHVVIVAATCLLSASGLSWAQPLDPERLFQQALDSLYTQTRPVHDATEMLGSRGLARFLKPARALAKRLGPDDIGFLKGKVHAGEKEDLQGLAAVTLAAMDAHRGAVEALQEFCAHNNPNIRRVGAAAIWFASPDTARQIATNMVGTVADGNLHAQFVQLLGVVGDEHSLRVLEDLRNDPNPQMRTGAGQAIALLRDRLELQDASARAASQDEALTYWRAHQGIGMFRNPVTDHEAAAAVLARQGVRISLPFLRQRLAAADATAAAVIGRQGEKEGVDDLVEHAAERSLLGEVARRALVRLDAKSQVARALESALSPDDINRSRDMVAALLTYGDERSVPLLERLSQDQAYADSAREEFRRNAQLLAARLRSRAQTKAASP